MSSRIIPVVSKRIFNTTIAFIALLTLCSCQTAPTIKKTSIQLQAFQTKQFETTKKIAFASVISVFQDLGYTIGTADLETGFITASSPTKQEFVLFVGQSMQRINATAFIEDMGKNGTRVRLNFVNSTQTSSGYGMKGQEDRPIEDPKFYQDAFANIQKAIFVRKNIDA